jgi:hypothetical protein
MTSLKKQKKIVGRHGKAKGGAFGFWFGLDWTVGWERKS